MNVSREAAWPGDVSRSDLLGSFIGITYSFAKTLNAKGEKCFGSEGMCALCVFASVCGTHTTFFQARWEKILILFLYDTK